MWFSFCRAVAAGTSHRLWADTVCLTLADSFVLSSLLPHLHRTEFSLGSGLTVFLQIPLWASSSSLPKLPVEILADCSSFIWDKKYTAIEPSSHLIYSSVNTLVIACNNLLVQTTVFYTYWCGWKLSICEYFLSLAHFSWFIFDTFLKGCFVALGKLSDGKVLLNVLCVYALRWKIYKQYFRYIWTFFHHAYSHPEGQ